MSGILRFTGIVLGAGAATWLATTYPAVYQAESERARKQRQFKEEQSKVNKLQNELQALEGKIDVLTKELENEGKELSEINKQAADAKAKLDALQALQAEKIRAFEESRKARIQAEARVQPLKEEWSRGSVLIQSVQEDLQATQARVQAARDQLNPLNNRLIKQLLSR
eukprot:jgi/Botrbrau1/6310/Bobra.0339s0021.1